MVAASAYLQNVVFNSERDMKYLILITFSLTLYGCKDIRKEYHSNGNIKSIVEYRNDLPNGMYENYDVNGNLIEKGVTLNGEKNGTCYWYYENGNVEIKARYEKGVENGPITHYFKSGALQDSTHFVNGLQHGLLFTYYEDGNIDRIQEYENDTLNGIFKYFYPNGNLAMDAKIKKGTTTYYIKYDSLGNVTDEFSNCLNVDSWDTESYRPKVIIPQRDYLILDSIETIRISVDNVPTPCFTVSISNGTIQKTGYPDKYQVRVQEAPDNKIDLSFRIISNSESIALGTYELEVRTK